MRVARGVEIDAVRRQFARELERIDEVAVVAERDAAAVLTDLERGLRVLELPGRARRRVPDVADREVAGETVEHLLVEDLRDEAELRVDEEVLTVADGDPGRFLAAVLEGVETEIREPGDILAGCVYAEDPALFAGTIEHVVHTGRHPIPDARGHLQSSGSGRGFRPHGFRSSGFTISPGSRT